MTRIQVNITCYLDKIANIDEILPEEFAVGNQYKEEGILEHLLIKDGRTGAILVFKDIDEAKAKELVARFPLFPHFEKVEYSVVEKYY